MAPDPDSIWDTVWDWFGSLGRSISNIYNWIIDYVWKFWDWLSKTWSNFWDWSSKTVSNLWDWLSKTFSNLWDWLSRTFSNLWDWLSKTFSNLWDWLSRTFSNLWDWLSRTFSNLWDWLSRTFSNIWDWLSRTFSNIWDWLSTTFSNLWDWLSRTLSAGWDWIVDHVKYWSEWVWEKVEPGFTWLKENLVDPVWTFMTGIWESLKSVLSGIWETIKGWLTSAWQWAVEFFTVDVWNAVRGAVSWLSKVVQDMGHAYINMLFNLGNQFSPIGPESAPGVAAGAHAIALTTGGVLAAMTVGGELMHPLKEIGMGHVAAIIGDLVNYQLVGGLITGALLGALIKTPLTYYVQRAFRPNIPREVDLEMMFAKHEITTGEFDMAMSHYGYSDKWLDVYHEYIWRDPRLFEIVRIAQITMPPAECPPDRAAWLARAGISMKDSRDWWYYIKCAKAGYDISDIHVLVEACKAAVSRREQTAFLMQIRRLYRDGMLSDQRERALLEEAWRSRPPIEFRQMANRLEVEYEEKADGKELVLSAVSHGLLTFEQGYNFLTRLGLDSLHASLALAREKIGLAPKLRLDAIET